MRLGDDLLVEPDPARRHQRRPPAAVADEPRVPQPLVQPEAGAPLKAPPAAGPAPRTASRPGPADGRRGARRWCRRRAGGGRREGRGCPLRGAGRKPSASTSTPSSPRPRPASAASAAAPRTWPPRAPGRGSGPRSARGCRPAAQSRRNSAKPKRQHGSPGRRGRSTVRPGGGSAIGRPWKTRSSRARASFAAGLSRSGR